MAPTSVLPVDVGVFGPTELDALEQFFRDHGFAVLRGLWPDDVVDAVLAECESAQARVVRGELDERHGTTELVDDAVDDDRQAAFANYVTFLTELAPRTRAAILDPVVVELVRRWVGDGARLFEHTRFGVVFQDARPGSESSYTRIGWHSDWQSAPHRPLWPSVAFTIHLDATSPENGFLRVVPGSHRWATPAPYRNVNGVAVPAGSAPWGGHTPEPPPVEMPLGFDKVPGEIGLYCERGDLLFHDAYLWHSAARATDDRGTRRHVRGSWYQGEETPEEPDDFVKNAAR
jgi:ectoine hydroxylase-related dioxygenase (phytanoyl-CoA dioxygenase family)